MNFFTKTHFITFILVLFCCLSTTMFADTLATDSTSFATAFAALQTSGGGTITLQNDITFRIAKNQTYSLVSDAADPIQINTQQFKIISSGTGTTADSAIFRVSNNVSITGTAIVLNSLSRAIIRVDGGSVITTASAGIANSAAIQTNAGWVYVSGGTVGVSVTAPTTAYAILMSNYMSAVITGGTISAIGDKTRALSITDGSSSVISGATITANGASAYAVQALGGVVLTIGNNNTFTTSSTNATDAALVSGGATSVIVIPANATNVNITSSVKYKLDNTAATCLDLRGVTLTANPVSGTAFVNPTNITLTATGNTSLALNKIYYNYNSNPVTTSASIASGGVALAQSSNTTIIASVGVPNANWNPVVYTFTYTVQNPSYIQLVGTFAALQAAFTYAQTATGTTQIQFTSDITTSGSYSFIPDATHPVTVDANGKNFIVASSGTLGGNLAMSSTTTTGIIKLTGAFVTTIAGGTYTVNGNAPVIFGNSGSGITDAATKLYLSNSTFTVNGTSNAAGIVKFASQNGNLLSATNCTFNSSAKGVAFSCIGPQNITIKNCTLTIAGSDATSQAFYYAPTSQASNYLTIDGLALSMSAGSVVNWGKSANKNIITIVKDLTITGSPTLLVNNFVTGTSLGTWKFYDFRAFNITSNVASGQYRTDPNITLAMTPTAVLPVDATGATLVYTLDGTDPVSTSAVYSAPFSFAGGTIKAAVMKDGFIGKIVTYTYSAAGEPTTAAPTPPVYATPKVISIFSDAYTNVTGTDFNPNWGQTGSDAIIQVVGNNTLKMANLNYQGIQFGSPVNALPMNFLHVDAFSPNETSLTVSCISATTGEKLFQLTPLNLNAWNSYDIPLTAFTSQGLSVSDLIQFKFVGAGGNTVYLDNLYFYNSDPTPDTQAPTSFTAVRGAVASDAVELLLNATDNSGAIVYSISYGTTPTVITTAGISGIQKSFTVSGLNASTDYSFSVTASDPTGNTAANSPIVITARTLTPLPAAPTPTVDATKVISIFSDAYTNVSGTDFNPSWGQSTVESMVQLSGNNTIKYMNLNYQGIALASSVDASAMNKLHVDIYPVDETSLQVTPISPATPANKEFSVALTPLNLNAWNSYDLLLSSFTGVDMSNVIQFKFTGSGGKTVYMDNLYFYTDVTGISNLDGSTGINCYPNPVSNRLTIQAKSDIYSFIITNLLGQTVKASITGGLVKSIDTSDLSEGNYFITVKLVNGQQVTQKLVKQ